MYVCVIRRPSPKHGSASDHSNNRRTPWMSRMFQSIAPTQYTCLLICTACNPAISVCPPAALDGGRHWRLPWPQTTKERQDQNEPPPAGQSLAEARQTHPAFLTASHRLLAEHRQLTSISLQKITFGLDLLDWHCLRDPSRQTCNASFLMLAN